MDTACVASTLPQPSCWLSSTARRGHGKMHTGCAGVAKHETTLLHEREREREPCVRHQQPQGPKNRNPSDTRQRQQTLTILHLPPQCPSQTQNPPNRRRKPKTNKIDSNFGTRGSFPGTTLLSTPPLPPTNEYEKDKNKSTKNTTARKIKRKEGTRPQRRVGGLGAQAGA